jgi:hypothetical protein
VATKFSNGVEAISGVALRAVTRFGSLTVPSVEEHEKGEREQCGDDPDYDSNARPEGRERRWMDGHGRSGSDWRRCCERRICGGGEEVAKQSGVHLVILNCTRGIDRFGLGTESELLEHLSRRKRSRKMTK